MFPITKSGYVSITNWVINSPSLVVKRNCFFLAEVKKQWLFSWKKQCFRLAGYKAVIFFLSTAFSLRAGFGSASNDLGVLRDTVSVFRLWEKTSQKLHRVSHRISFTVVYIYRLFYCFDRCLCMIFDVFLRCWRDHHSFWMSETG